MIATPQADSSHATSSVWEFLAKLIPDNPTAHAIVTIVLLVLLAVVALVAVLALANGGEVKILEIVSLRFGSLDSLDSFAIKMDDKSHYFVNAAPLWSQLYNVTPHVIHSVDCDVKVHPDYTVSETYTLSVSASTEPVAALAFMRASDVPLKRFADMELTVLDSNQMPLPWVPAVDKPTEKKFLIFFHPMLQPGSAPVSFTMRSQWPKAAKKLKNSGSPDRTFVSFQQAVATAQFKITVECRGQFKAQVDGCGALFIPDPNNSREIRHAFRNVKSGQEVGISIERHKP